MIYNISSRHYLIGLMLLFILVGIFIYIPLNIYPAEDATILFQYSENLAQTGAITYNKNDVHAEGATDFLWMVLLGFMHFVGFNTYIASTILSMLALIGTAYLLFRITNTNNINFFFLFVIILILLPMIPATIQGFSPLFFGFFITLVTYFFLENNPDGLFISAFLACLVRPDGTVFVLPLIVLFFLFDIRILKKNIIKLIGYFIVPGAIYFFWRWNYFGEFLPLPFYVKSNFDRYLFFFNRDSLKQNCKMGVFFLPAIIFITSSFWQNGNKRKMLVIFISIIFVPIIFYSAMTLSQNVCYRFQYPMILGLFILSAFVLSNHGDRKKLRAFLVCQIIFIFPISGKAYLSLSRIPNQQILSVAKGLNKITTDASMAITEAGRLPYYSKWHAIDTWGLNTPKYAKKLIHPDDIRAANTDLIVVHAAGGDYSSLLNLDNIPIHNKRKWSNMTDNIFKGIDMNRYTLYMLPFYQDNNNFLSNLYFKLEAIYRKYNNQTNSDRIRYDAYFVKNNFRYSRDVKGLLQKHNAITFDNYLKIIN